MHKTHSRSIVDKHFFWCPNKRGKLRCCRNDSGNYFMNVIGNIHSGNIKSIVRRLSHQPSNRRRNHISQENSTIKVYMRCGVHRCERRTLRDFSSSQLQSSFYKVRLVFDREDTNTWGQAHFCRSICSGDMRGKEEHFLCEIRRIASVLSMLRVQAFKYQLPHSSSNG